MTAQSQDSSKDDVEDLKAAEAKDLHRAVREEGESELNRSVSALFWSGIAAGLAACASLVAESAIYSHTPDTPARMAIVSLGYPIGFLIAILGRMQLFTESTVTAMLPLVAEPSWASLWRTLRLWGVVLAANLIGTATISVAFAHGVVGDPPMHQAMIAIASIVSERGPWDIFLNAIPAGFLIATVAWVLPSAREQAFLLIFSITYVVAVGGFNHSILGSVETFLLLWAGKIGAVKAIGGMLIPAIGGNLVGGAGLFALLAHAQVADEVGGQGKSKVRRPRPLANRPDRSSPR